MLYVLKTVVFMHLTNVFVKTVLLEVEKIQLYQNLQFFKFSSFKSFTIWKKLNTLHYISATIVKSYYLGFFLE